LDKQGTRTSAELYDFVFCVYGRTCLRSGGHLWLGSVSGRNGPRVGTNFSSFVVVPPSADPFLEAGKLGQAFAIECCRACDHLLILVLIVSYPLSSRCCSRLYLTSYRLGSHAHDPLHQSDRVLKPTPDSPTCHLSPAFKVTATQPSRRISCLCSSRHKVKSVIIATSGPRLVGPT
jgi:hypothetical protein